MIGNGSGEENTGHVFSAPYSSRGWTRQKNMWRTGERTKSSRLCTQSMLISPVFMESAAILQQLARRGLLE